MRFWLSLFLLAPALLAQAPAEQHNYWHFQPPPSKKFFAGNPAPKPMAIPPGEVAVVVAPKPPQVEVLSKTCSIPLIDVLKSRAGLKYHMKRIPRDPAAAEHFQMPNVTLPAPPCDDGKR